jgi:hypothetical protein
MGVLEGWSCRLVPAGAGSCRAIPEHPSEHGASTTHDWFRPIRVAHNGDSRPAPTAVRNRARSPSSAAGNAPLHHSWIAIRVAAMRAYRSFGAGDAV